MFNFVELIWLFTILLILEGAKTNPNQYKPVHTNKHKRLRRTKNILDKNEQNKLFVVNLKKFSLSEHLSWFPFFSRFSLEHVQWKTGWCWENWVYSSKSAMYGMLFSIECIIVVVQHIFHWKNATFLSLIIIKKEKF